MSVKSDGELAIITQPTRVKYNIIIPDRKKRIKEFKTNIEPEEAKKLENNINVIVYCRLVPSKLSRNSYTKEQITFPANKMSDEKLIFDVTLSVEPIAYLVINSTNDETIDEIIFG